MRIARYVFAVLGLGVLASWSASTLAAQNAADIQSGVQGRYKIFSVPKGVGGGGMMDPDRPPVADQGGYINGYHTFLLDTFTGNISVRLGVSDDWNPYVDGPGAGHYHLAVASSGGDDPYLLLVSTDNGKTWFLNPKTKVWVVFAGGE